MCYHTGQPFPLVYLNSIISWQGVSEVPSMMGSQPVRLSLTLRSFSSGTDLEKQNQVCDFESGFRPFPFTRRHKDWPQNPRTPGTPVDTWACGTTQAKGKAFVFNPQTKAHSFL